MSRYVLTYRGGAGSAPAAEINQIAAAGRIIDRDARVLLLESEEPDTAQLAKLLPRHWSIEPERSYPVPDTQEKVRKPAVD
jgi:hypothetical protein